MKKKDIKGQKKTRFILKVRKIKYKKMINLPACWTGYLYLMCKEKQDKKKKKLALIFAGSVMGLLNGFFGGGGGMICVPILQKFLKLKAKQAHATAILVIFPLSLISAFIYVLNGYITTLPLLVVGGGFVIGGIIGAFALKFLPPKAVRIIFAIVMFAGGVRLII